MQLIQANSTPLGAELKLHGGLRRKKGSREPISRLFRIELWRRLEQEVAELVGQGKTLAISWQVALDFDRQDTAIRQENQR